MNSIEHVKRTKPRQRDCLHQCPAYTETLFDCVTRHESCFLNAIVIHMVSIFLLQTLSQSKKERREFLMSMSDLSSSISDPGFHVPDTFQLSAISQFSAFLACRKINKLRVFNTRQYSDSPRLQDHNSFAINRLRRICGVDVPLVCNADGRVVLEGQSSDNVANQDSGIGLLEGLLPSCQSAPRDLLVSYSGWSRIRPSPQLTFFFSDVS